MILLAGIPSETPLQMVRTELERLGTPYVQFNQRQFDRAQLELSITEQGIGGQFDYADKRYELADFSGAYFRFMDDRDLPELEQEPEGSARRQHARALHEVFTRWLELAPGNVVNRISPMGSNFSKPYQLQLVAEQGFDIPETLITNDPEQVLEFREQHSDIIYKSISGLRSIVKILSEDDLERLDAVRWCPVQFQAFVPGTNVRVHTVGDAVFATAIDADTTDYRYASTQGGTSHLRTLTLADELSERCVALANALGLAFAGIDLKITPEGRAYCFEVNPMPAFSYYEANTGQPIAQAVAGYLSKN